MAVIPLCIAEDAVDEEDSLPWIRINDNDEDIPDVDCNFLDKFPAPPPPKETDIQFILNLVEKRKWQTKTYQALEKLTCCLYSYYDIVFQVLQASQCYGSLPSDIPESWQGAWMNADPTPDVENATSKFPYPCSLRTHPENATSPGVNVVNASECMRILELEPETDEHGSSKLHCALVLFFSRQCPFSIKMAPNYNALGRAFPGLDIMAVDVSQSSG